MLASDINARVITHMVSNNAKPIGVKKMNIANTVNRKMPEIKSVMEITGASRGEATFMVIVSSFEAYRFSSAKSESEAFKVLAMRDELALLCHPEIKNVAKTRELNKELYIDRVKEIKNAA